MRVMNAVKETTIDVSSVSPSSERMTEETEEALFLTFTGVDDGKDNNNELREMLEEFQGKMQDVHAELTGRHQRQMLKLQQMRGDNKGLWYMVFTDKLGRRTSKASELGSTDLELMHRTEGFLNNAANSSSDGFNPRATETLETKHYDREKAASPGQVNCGQDETEA